MTALPPRPVNWLQHPALKGSVALVAGGGSGIGEAAAHTLAASGARIAVADRRPEMAQKVAADLAETGAKAIAITMDVTSQSDIDAAVAQVRKEFGRLDMLVNTAGVISPAELESLDLAVWRKTFEVNVDGASACWPAPACPCCARAAWPPSSTSLRWRAAAATRMAAPTAPARRR